MGLLEQLEQEAEQQRREAARAISEECRRARRWSEELLPAMRSLDVYLQNLVDRLTQDKPVGRVVAPLPGYGDVVAYLDHRYTLRSAPTGESYEIALHFSAEVASSECPVIEATGASGVSDLAATLWSQRLFGLLHSSKDADGEVVAASFQARGRIQMKLRVFADRASGVARMHSSNLDGFSQSTRSFSPEQLTPSMFDRIGRYIARVDRGLQAASMVERAERRLRVRRTAGVRLQADDAGKVAGRRVDDFVAASRLRPWLRSGALP